MTFGAASTEVFDVRTHGWPKELLSQSFYISWPERDSDLPLDGSDILI